MEGKKLIFTIEAHDEVDLISAGRHERFVIERDRFDAKLGSKRRQARREAIADAATDPSHNPSTVFVGNTS